MDLKQKKIRESITDYSETFISLDRVLYMNKNTMYVVEGDKESQYVLNREEKKFSL